MQNVAPGAFTPKKHIKCAPKTQNILIMNAHAPQQTAANELPMHVKYLLFDLQTYGSKVNYTHKTAAIPYELQLNPRLINLSKQVRTHGWYVQIGII